MVEAGGGEEAAPTLASILASTGNIDASTGATLSAPTTPLANAGASPPPFPDHLDVCSKQIPESVDVAITDRAEKTRCQLLGSRLSTSKPRAPVVHVAPGRTAKAWGYSTSRMSSSGCRAMRPVPCAICCRQETPVAAMIVSAASARTAGKSRSSPMLMESS